ncbi:MAG: MMPL family transporter [Gammaproteobacteria bacterium]|nr:MMPL family transporter [Gammaproteobacteria bacterium]
MSSSLENNFYDRLVFGHSKWVLLAFVVLLVGLSKYAANFRLDASSDSLVLENDQSLKYFREVVSKYSAADLLIVTYSPKGDLFDDSTLNDLSALREKILKVDMVAGVNSILDVPLTQSPPVTLAELASSPQTLLDERTDRELVKKEFLESELFKDLLVSDDLGTTAIAISVQSDQLLNQLLTRRNELRELRANEAASPEQLQELEKITLEHQARAEEFGERQAILVANMRELLDQHRDKAKLFLGGVPMIAADSVSFIEGDVVVFGTAALVVIVLILSIAFRQLGWIIMPLINCVATGFLMVCLLGLLNWPISVVSSNFLSLLLIITLSLNIHLIVRYRELAKEFPDKDQRSLLSATVRSKFIPCIYTALTTIVAFASLIVSGIRPVIDFGWIMCLGITVAVVTTFTLFPALAMLMKPTKVESNRDVLSKLVLNGAQQLHAKGGAVSAFFGLVGALAVYGCLNLTVENRFIDYFKPETEIYQGMVEIDTKLGGTTPLDIILDPPSDWVPPTPTNAEGLLESVENTNGAGNYDIDDFDDFDTYQEVSSEDGDDFDDFDDFDFDEESEIVVQAPNLVATSYWFNTEGLNKIKAIQKSLEAIEGTGKVMSLATTMSVFSQLRGAGELDDIDLGFMYNALSEDNKKTLFAPYLSADGNQIHINIRVFETTRGLDRNKLIADIRSMLVNEHGLEDEQVNITGLVVMYNNMLNSLFNSQIATLGTVFVVIFLMFIVLFRSMKLALLTIVPNVFSAAVVLGIMGLFTIPLDLMTITIAAISVGIAVDNSIHFVHRFTDEIKARAEYSSAIDIATKNVGQAMFYTTIVITAGFMIMVFSNFVPTMYFGVLTGIAMVTALIANLVMLPMLIKVFKPIKVD